jgi:hypothetical protein
MVKVANTNDGAGIPGYTWGTDEVLDVPLEVAERIVGHNGFYYAEVVDVAPGEVVASVALPEVERALPPEVEPHNPYDLQEALEVSSPLVNRPRPKKVVAKKAASKG